jgi:hypothetical protein
MGRRDFILVAVGLVLASLLAILGTKYVIDTWVVPPDMSDPLARQGGLKPEHQQLAPKR